MATSSFAYIENWESNLYQTIQSIILEEVTQGLWENQDHLDTWCAVDRSPTQGFENLWVLHTYQRLNNPSQTITVIWPADWPAPAENINGELPCHFFSGQTGSKTALVMPPFQVSAPPTFQPVYKPAGECI
jgi:hypothetical protein